MECAALSQLFNSRPVGRTAKHCVGSASRGPLEERTGAPDRDTLDGSPIVIARHAFAGLQLRSIVNVADADSFPAVSTATTEIVLTIPAVP